MTVALEGYTGPTSGRITIGGGGEVKRERFTDPPLSADEAAAVAWFTALSPNEQLREVRRLKWNLDVADIRKNADSRIIADLRRTEAQAAAERDARRPDGFEYPRSAAELRAEAGRYGRPSAVAWTVGEDGEVAQLEMVLAAGEWRYRLSWAVPKDKPGGGALLRRGLARGPGRDWHDAPPLRDIRRRLAGEGT